MSKAALAVLQEGSVTTKNSTARNLHRLLSAVEFIKILMANLAQDPKMTLHNACYDAYNRRDKSRSCSVSLKRMQMCQCSLRSIQSARWAMPFA